MAATPELSAVVPVYNESAAVERVVADLGRELAALVEHFEVIVVDDASTDETPAILERLARRHPWLRVERSARNAGHGPSVIRGLELARAPTILQIDSDAQFVVAEVGLLWARRHDSDLALGVRVRRHDPRHRLVLTRVVRLASSLLAGYRLRDPNTPFRLLRRAVWEDIRPLLDETTLAPNIFVAVGAAVRAWRISEVPVTHLPREGGTISLRSFRLVSFSLRGLAELVALRARLARFTPRVVASEAQP